MRFLKLVPYKIFYRTSMNEDALFKTLDRREKPRNFNNIELTPLYKHGEIKNCTKNE